MKKIYRLLFTLLAAAGIAACQQYTIDTQAAVEPKLESDALEAYDFAAVNPQPVTFTVAATAPWTITRSENAEWCSVSPASSSVSGLSSDVTIAVDANETLAPRSVTLTLKAEGVANSYTITVTQSKKGTLAVQPVSGKAVAAGGNYPFTINTNQAWEAVSSEQWVTFSKSSGTGSGTIETIQAIVAKNTTLERTATVTVTAGDYKEEFTITQESIHLNVQPVADAISAAGGSADFTVESDHDWTVRSSETWLTLSTASGAGDGAVHTITATAAVNSSIARKATVTIEAGELRQEFQVSQKGLSLSIAEPESKALAPKGETIFLDVEASMEWQVECDNAEFTVVKTGDTQIKLVAPFNKYFAAREITVSVKPVSASFGDVKGTLTLTQDTNFELKGDYTLNEDGSVTLRSVASGTVSRICLKDGYRYLDATLAIDPERSEFKDAPQFWFQGKLGAVNIYNQLSIGGNTRVRTDGNLADEGATSAYKSSSYSITVDELNAMTEYRVKMQPNADDATKMDFGFYVNGTAKKEQTGPNPFHYTTDPVTDFYFGFYGNTSDGTYYTVRSCDIIVIEG